MHIDHYREYHAANPCATRLLIAHDDENVPAMAAELVERLGYNVLVASNGIEALEILRKNKDVTILFSDISIPGMDGEELMFVRPELRVIFTSGARDR